MKKHLLFSILVLSAFSVQADGVNLTCAPYQSCVNCPEYQTLFPIQEFSTDPTSIEVEADRSEVSQNNEYFLSGDVKLKSGDYLLSADKVEFSGSDKSTFAEGNIEYQDAEYLIVGDSFFAKKENDLITAAIDNTQYQEIKNNANGHAESIIKKGDIVVFNKATYSYCPINQSDWQVKAKTIVVDLEKNRGIADHATIMFMGYPIFYFPKHSWVLEGRGSGFLSPSFERYEESQYSDKSSPLYDPEYSKSIRIRIPYYFNIAPDRDLILASTYMQSRGFVIDNRYQQLLDRKITEDGIKDSMFEIETEYLPRDYITHLKRWLINTTVELDISDKMHISAKYNRASDTEYFKEIKHSETDVGRLLSHLEITYEDPENYLTAALLTEDEQIVNVGTPAYTRALEGSISKTFNTENKLPVTVSLVSTKFAHDTPGKDSGVRTHGDLGITKTLSTEFPVVTTRANVSNTHYELKNKNNINRTVAGAGIDFAFPFISQRELFNAQVIRTITPKISYNYRAKELQGNIPLFDTEDEYDDIITFAALTSGERYTGLDRITNANDVTLSFESSYRDLDAEEEDLDLLSFRIAQSFYADDEVVSDTANTNYETRLSYSDIAAGIGLAVNQFAFNTDIQYNPDTSKLVKRTYEISYKVNPRKFIALAQTYDGDFKKNSKIYGSFPLTDTVHLFGGLDRTTSTGVTNKETTGVAYESCCWAFRLVHFKNNTGSTETLKNYDYNTGFELILKGLGSSSPNFIKRIENNIPYYQANLSE
jgi:LPS-assembly protein